MTTKSLFSEQKTWFMEERQLKILDMLKSNKTIAVSELCDFFGVSASTIRTDLRDLEHKNLLLRTHGGAITNSKVNLEIRPDRKSSLMMNQKKEIAKYAASLVEDGDTIAISTGTTTYEFAKQLLSKKNLTIVVNDVQLAYFLEESTTFSIFMLGGLIRNSFHYTSTVYSIMPTIFCDKMFFSCNGLTVEHGATVPDFVLANNIKKMINYSAESILLCDSSKIGNFFFSQIAPISGISRILCDSDANKNFFNNISSEDKDKIIIIRK